MKKVNIISGWSNPGGSTIHHINLTNMLNEGKYDCTFYGPHEWHLSQCKSNNINELLGQDPALAADVTISHFCQLREKPKGKHILSLHETNLFPLKQLDLSQWDLIHYVSNKQRAWHNVNHPYVVIPGRTNKFKWEDPQNKVAGVVGSIDSHKQTHISIKRAFDAGYKKVKLFGEITELEYFNREIQGQLHTGKVEVMNHVDDREVMYGQVSAVFSSSKRECLPTIQGECLYAGIPFFGLESNLAKESDYEFDDSVIFKKWESCFNV